MTELVLPLVLLVLGLFLLTLEAFIPSAGILGTSAAISLAGAVGTAFYQGGMMVGTGFMGFTIVVVGTSMRGLVKWWPHTALGKRFLIEPASPDSATPSKLSELRQLVGQIGRAAVVMLPGGVVEIGGRNYDAVAERGVVEQGMWVEVVAVRGLNLIVRPVSAEVARRTRPEGDDAQAPRLEISDPFPDPFAEPLT